MSRLYSSKEIEAVLIRLGFRFISQKGSHVKYKNGEGRTIIVPGDRKEIPAGTFKSILRQAGIDLAEYKKHA